MNRNLDNIYWIGGSPCSGKSSIVNQLSKTYNTAKIHCDDYTNEHIKKINKNDYPTMYTQSTMSWNDLFMRSVKAQVIKEFQYYMEEFQLVLEDVEKVKKRPLFIEGAGLLPECLYNNNINIDKAIFLVPTREFQLFHYEKREFKDVILSECLNPTKAYENWMKRDIEYADLVEYKASKMGYRVIRVKLNSKTDDLFGLITGHFKIGRR